MSSPRLVSGRIKLEIPKTNDRIHAAHKNVFLKNFDQCGFQISDGLENEVEEAGCSPFVEVYYEVRHEDFSKALLLATQSFLREVASLDFPHHAKGGLVIHSQDVFTRRLITDHMAVPVGAVIFGQLQAGILFSHWEVSFDYGQKRDEMKMRANFEYDRSDIIVISFDTPEHRGKKDEKPSKPGTANYRIVIQWAQIRRIIIDNGICDKYGANRIRMNLELNSPPSIRSSFKGKDYVDKGTGAPPYERKTTIKRGRQDYEFPKDKAISDSSMFSLEFGESVSLPYLYEIISRLRFRCGTSIEFASIVPVDCFIAKDSPYHRWVERDTHPLDEKDNTFFDFLKRSNLITNVLDPSDKQKATAQRRFAIRYLLECLFSRGAVVKDQLWLQESHWKIFLATVSRLLLRDFELCEIALERLITLIDERKRIGFLVNALQKMFTDSLNARNAATILEEQEKREGYQRVRKLILTPTRVIYVVPEMLMSNRVIRDFDPDGTRVLRISLRDDDNQKMRKSKTGEYLIDKTIKDYFRGGVTVAGREFGYLGSSNSQMRDNGAYFMIKMTKSQRKEYIKKHNKEPGPEVITAILEVRNQLGRFTKVESVPKYMARLGQCFTQSRETKVPLSRDRRAETFDIIGGAAKDSLAVYTFSDGVGMMSKEYAQKISMDFNGSLGYSSCYQFRYKGMKGVLAVNPLLDEISEWARANDIPKPNEDGEIQNWSLDCVARESQIKFIGARQDYLEIVKPSCPVPVALNKPFINILDQVSEMQSVECHKRVVNRIESLLDRHIRGLAGMLISEQHCRNKLKELPRRIDIDRLSTRAGFQLCNEPFFRAMVKSATKHSITKQLRKEQIQVPFSLGRSLLGVIDETGRLQYGQIYVQYTKNIQLKFPPPNAQKIVLKGTVLVTKNPCNVAGDVRVFEAVDIKELHHMVDVIVFPQHGPRPHPDEMAGSDLDGDEYSVLWDPELLLERNEPAFDYSADKFVEALDPEKLNEKMIDFYQNYMLQDSVGVISNNFLHQSVLYGIGSTVCINLAKKISMAVDFTKSGKPPPPLTTKWGVDEKTGEELPPEKADLIPDFHSSSTNNKPVYICPRLIGSLYREIKTIEDVLRLSEDRDEQVPIEMDPLIDVEGWQNFQDMALDELAKYNTLIRQLMENYGIRTEAELISGYICEMRNRISDKDQDDMSFFNTNHLIEQKVTNICRKFREDFFEQFGGWQQCTEKLPKLYCDENNIFHRECKVLSDEMRQKAVAYYKMAYERAIATKEKLLSFAWLPYEVIADVRQTKLIENTGMLPPSNPLITILDKHNEEYIEEYRDRFEEFRQFSAHDMGDSVRILNIYCRKHPGLDKIFFILCEWAFRSDILSSTRIEKEHICLLFLLFAIDHFNSITGEHSHIFCEISLDDDANLTVPEEEQEPVDNHRSKDIFNFFEFLASRKFAKIDALSFGRFKHKSVFIRGEWKPLHKSAMQTYYNLVFNMRFEELPLTSFTERCDDPVSRECEPFVIELPENSNINLVRGKLIQKSNVAELALRRIPRCQEERYTVSARGSLETLEKLRNIVLVQPDIKGKHGKEIGTELTKLVYNKIMS